MGKPTENLYVHEGNGFTCEKCGEVIGRGDKWTVVKWKKYRKRGIYLVCESCAEGIIKEFENKEGKQK